MNKEKFSILKQKITPKETVEKNSANQDRFAVADNILIPVENEIKKSLVLRKKSVTGSHCGTRGDSIEISV